VKLTKNAQFRLAVLMVIFGIIMIIAGFICPPVGIIDSSVLVAYGETLTFAGSIIGIDYNYRNKRQ
jgi:uncharacterized membrane protein